MPNVSRGRLDARFRRTWTSRWKRFVEWAKRLLLYGRFDWRKASDDAKPLRLTAAERAALEPKFALNAIKPRSVSAADLAPSAPAGGVLQPPAPTPAAAQPVAGLPIDPALLAAAISAVQQQQSARGEGAQGAALDPTQVAAALQAIQQAGIPTAPATVRSPEAIRAAERDHARRYKRRRRSSSRAKVNPLTGFDTDNLPPSKLESKVEKWFRR